MKKVDQKLDEILEQCLADIKSGRATREDCLLRYKEQAAELAPLLRAAVSLYKLPAPRPSERRVLAGRQRILQELSAAERTPWWIGLRRALTAPTLAFSAALAFVLVTILGAGTAFMAYRDSLPTQEIPTSYPNPGYSQVTPPTNTPPTTQPSVTFNGIGLSDDQTGPYEMASAPDGVLWFVQTDTAKVGSVNAENRDVRDWPTISNASRAGGVTVDANGRVWYTVSSSQSLVALDPNLKQSSSWRVPSAGALGRITTGADGVLWFIADDGERIYSFEAKTGVFTPYAVKGVQYVKWANDTLWFSGESGKLGQITADGQVRMLDVPGDPADMVWDGASLWYAGGALVGRFDVVSGKVDTFALESGYTDRIATDGLGNIWFGSQGGAELGVLQTQSGQISMRPLESIVRNLYSLAVGTDKIWISDSSSQFIYTVNVSGAGEAGFSVHLEPLTGQFTVALALP